MKRRVLLLYISHIRALQEQRRGKSEKKQKDKKVGTPGPKVRKTESVKGTPRGR